MLQATLRVPLMDHECSVQFSCGSSRPIQLVIDGVTTFMTVEGLDALVDRLGKARELSRDDAPDR